MGNWQSSIIDPAKVVLAQIGQLLVNLLIGILILIIGWLISKLLKTIVTRLLRVIKVDELSKKIELDNILAKGGISYSFSELVGVICYWLALLITVVVAINAGGLTVAADLLGQIVLYVPNVIAAIFILILGMFVAKILHNIVKTAANNSGLSQANLLSKIVEVAVLIFTIAIALEQLNIGANIIAFTVNIVLASIGLALALAFGLGSKDIAAKSLADFIEKLKARK